MPTPRSGVDVPFIGGAGDPEATARAGAETGAEPTAAAAGAAAGNRR